jgi:hypothetical protein
MRSVQGCFDPGCAAERLDRAVMTQLAALAENSKIGQLRTKLNYSKWLMQQVLAEVASSVLSLIFRDSNLNGDFHPACQSVDEPSFCFQVVIENDTNRPNKTSHLTSTSQLVYG